LLKDFDLTLHRCAVVAAIVWLSAAQHAIAQPTDAGAAPGVAYVDFPATIDPDHSHRHVAMKLGSRVYYRPGITIRQVIRSRSAGVVEQAVLVDAASTITRLRGETFVVEPDGSKWHLSPVATIDHSGRSYKYVVIPPGAPLPDYLKAVPADVYAR
jgi:hypothetical protein